MWKTLSNWLLAFLNMTREVQEHRATIKRLEERIRDQEEAIKLLAHQQRHAPRVGGCRTRKTALAP